MNQGIIVKSNITVAPELWHCSIMPEGILEGWLTPDGSRVQAGDPIAKVRVEDALHDLTAPTGGTLQVTAAINSVVEPGSVIGTIIRVAPAQDFFEDET